MQFFHYMLSILVQVNDFYYGNNTIQVVQIRILYGFLWWYFT